MPAPLATAAIGTAVPFVLNKIFGRRRKSAIADIIRRFMSEDPGGELSAADIAHGERQLGRASEVIGGGVQQGRGMATHRLRARGIVGPAEEQVHADIEQGGARARREASLGVADMLNEVRERTRDYNRSKQFAAFGAAVGDAQRQEGYDMSRQSGFYNSMVELLPNLLDFARTPGRSRAPASALRAAGNYGAAFPAPERRGLSRY